MGGFLAPLPQDLTSRKMFSVSGSHILISVYNQTRHGHVESTQQELFEINSQRSLLWSGDTSKGYKTVIQISGCNLVNYIGKITKGWGWLCDLQFLPMHVQKGPVSKRKPKLGLTNDHYSVEFLNPNFMENITMLSSKPEPLIMHKPWVSPGVLLSHLHNLSFCKAYDC